jgi:hypothetical protein
MHARLAVAALVGGVAVAFLVHHSGAAPVKPASRHVVAHTALSGKDISRSVAAIGDQADHELAQRVYSYAISSDDKDFDGLRSENFAQTDTVAGKGTHRGYAIWRNKQDDTIYIRFNGEHHPGAGGNAEYSGDAEISGGTGKFAHISGTAKYHGAITPSQQTSDVELDVTY